MPKTIIEFDVNDRRARAGFNRLQRELDEIERDLGHTQRGAETASNAFNQMGRSAASAGQLVDQFGRPLARAREEVDDLGDAARRTKPKVDDLGDSARRAGPKVGGFGDAAESARRNTNRWGISLGSLKGVFTGLGIAIATREVLEFGRASAQASIQIDSYTRALEVLEGSALAAENRIRALQDLADEPGLRFKDAVEGALALKAVRIEGELATRVLTELANASAFTGGEGEFQRGLLGLRQIAARGRISQEELNQLTENISIASTVLRNEFGTVLAEDIQKILDETGQSTTDFIETLISGFEKLERFPIDAPSVKLKNLSNSFFEFQASIGDTFLPVVASGAQGLTALFDTLTEGVTSINNFFDIIDERHNALLNASESAREFTVRLSDINTATGQSEAVNARIQTLHRLTTALRIEQSELSQSSEEYLQYAERIREAANELDLLRALRSAGTSDSDNTQILTQRTDELRRTNAEIKRYETLLANARQEAVGQTNPAIQQLERRLGASRAAAAALTREIELLKNGFQDFTPATTEAVSDLRNYLLEIAKLKAEAEDTRRALTDAVSPQLLTPNFQAAITASNAYYSERIRQAEAALAKEKEGTEAYNNLETRIFELGRQRALAERQITAENQRLLQQFSKERIDAAIAVREAEVQGFQTAAQAGNAYAKQLENIASLSQRRAFFDYVNQLVQQGKTFEEARKQAEAFFNQITAIPSAGGPDAQYGNFTSQLKRDFEDTERQGRSLLDVMREIVRLSVGPLDLDARIPDPGVRQQEIDERIAAEARGAQTLNDIRQEAGEQGRQFLTGIIRSEERAVQDSLRKQARSYRQFANLVSNTFINLATGRAQSFESVATAFIQQSLRIVLRAYVEYQIQKRLDDTLTASKIANIRRLADAQRNASAAGIGSLNIPGLGNLPGLGSLGSSLSGGGAALGAASLLFPEQIKNLTSGISDTIGNLLSNVASVPDKAFAPQQVFLKLGENEVRDITDIQDDLRQDDRV